MHSRVAIDPEVELDELRLDGELNYRCEELLFPTGMHVLTTAPLLFPTGSMISTTTRSGCSWTGGRY
jgi:hypothetical protein